MRYLIVVIFLLFTGFIFAQDSTETQVKTPKIVTKLFLGKQIEVGDYEIRFVEVTVDSRCPKNVNCVRAGEAKVLVEVFRDDEFVEKQLIEITPSTPLYEKYPIVFSTDNSVLKAYNLLPYPISGMVIKKEDFYLQIMMEN